MKGFIVLSVRRGVDCDPSLLITFALEVAAEPCLATGRSREP